MSLSLLVYLLLFVWLTFMAIQRPVYGVALYLLTFFGDPAMWWWGAPLISFRLNLFSAILAISSVLIHRFPSFRRLSDAWMEILLGLIVLNATFVHFGLAENTAVSLKAYDLLLKFAVLGFLMKHAIADKRDFMLMLMVFTLAMGHIGYEVKFNDAGAIQKGRLEGVGPPTADNSNHLASLLVTLLPLMGTLALVGSKWQKLTAFAAAPFAVNTLLLCSSRGAFLAALASAPIYLVLAPPRVRRIALIVVALGAVGTLLLLRDDKILTRFQTTFVSADQRDASASGRLDYWKAGLNMVRDYPLGAGGDAFKKTHGRKYRLASGHTEAVRAVHNGFINEACEWGIQGFLLKMTLLGVAFLKCIGLSRQASFRGDPNMGLIGAAIVSGAFAFLATCMFGDLLDNEWGMWLVALAAAFEVLLREGKIGNAGSGYVLYRIIPIQQFRSATKPVPSQESVHA